MVARSGFLAQLCRGCCGITRNRARSHRGSRCMWSHGSPASEMLAQPRTTWGMCGGCATSRTTTCHGTVRCFFEGSQSPVWPSSICSGPVAHPRPRCWYWRRTSTSSRHSTMRRPSSGSPLRLASHGSASAASNRSAPGCVLDAQKTHANSWWVVPQVYGLEQWMGISTSDGMCGRTSPKVAQFRDHALARRREKHSVCRAE